MNAMSSAQVGVPIYIYLQAEIPDTDFPVLATSLVKRFYINVWIGFLPALHFAR
jgi:hypothetical protein